MKAKTLLLQLVVAYATAGFAVISPAAMYKWTDKQGNIHYTQQPPQEGEAKEMAPPRRVATPSSNTGAAKNGEGVAKDKSAEVEPPLTPEQEEINRRNCEAAKGNLETYKSARRLKQADGEIVVMDYESRQKKMPQAEEQIKKFCK